MKQSREDAMGEPVEIYTYILDPENRIIHLSENWDPFALGNDGAEFVTKKIMGRSLWDFIRDSETICILDALLKRVRKTGTAIRLPLNCDSPDCRRRLELHLTSIPTGTVICNNRVLAVERRDVPAALLDRRVERSDRIIAMCSWCKKIEADGSWLDLEEAIVRIGLFAEQPLPRISHGICPSCYRLCMEST